MATAPAHGGKPVYAGAPVIKRMLKAARDCGLDVAGFDALPDGTIRVLEARAMPTPSEDLFDKLDQAGLL